MLLCVEVFACPLLRLPKIASAYTMVEMAKAHDLNVYGYLKFLLDHRPTKEMTDDQLAELAPWSQKLQSIKNRM